MGSESSFRFGELRERSLHRQLKTYFCPSDGSFEVKLGTAIADIWSPTLGAIEIQTGNLFKLRAKIPAYLDRFPVTVVYPVSARKTLVTWNAQRTAIVSQRTSPRKLGILASFREVGALAEWFDDPHFALTFCLVHEREHRCLDGEGSWRRKGVSIFDRELVDVIETKTFRRRSDWESLLPIGWTGPSTNTELARALGMKLTETRALTLCFKKARWMKVEGRRGRETLLIRLGPTSTTPNAS